MKEFYCIQADESGQGIELRLAMIKSRAKQCTPGLPPDLIQWIVKEEPDASKQNIGWISEVQCKLYYESVKEHHVPEGQAPIKVIMFT